MKAYEKFAAGLVLGTSLAAQALAESKYSPWGPPVNLGCVVNSASADLGPGITKDGLSLYFASNRADPGASGDLDLYVAQRPSRDAPWGSARNLGPGINSPAIDNVVSLSRDGHWMFFNSNRTPGGLGDVDIWASFRDHVHDDSAWGTPFNLGPGVNSTGFDAGASYFENEDGSAPLLFFNRGLSRATQATTTDIYVSELQPDGTFGNARLVSELNSPQADQRPSIRFDGLEIFFFSNRSGSMVDALGSPSFDIWVATRDSPNDRWDTPVNLGSAVNTGGAEQNPYISPDGLTLYFASDRPGGCGGLDLYMTTRTKRKGGDKAN
jgi:Tol biopolymer transport system component